MMKRLLVAIGAVAMVALPMQTNAQGFDIASIAALCGQNVESDVIDADCAAAVDSFIALNSGNTAGAPTAIGDLVTALALNETEVDGVCARLSNEVSKLGAASPDPSQGALIQEISVTLRDCQPIQTAAIGPLGASLF